MHFQFFLFVSKRELNSQSLISSEEYPESFNKFLVSILEQFFGKVPNAENYFERYISSLLKMHLFTRLIFLIN